MGHCSMTVIDEYMREASKKRMAVDIARAINTRGQRDAMKRRAYASRGQSICRETAGCSFLRLGNDLFCQGTVELPRTISATLGCLRTSIVNFASKLIPEELRNSRSVRSSIILSGRAAKISVKSIMIGE